MKQISTAKVQELIRKSKGKVFTVFFTKKDGTDRKMNCRIGVSKDIKGNGLAYSPSDYDLLTVYDMQAKGYRMINVNTVKALQINKQFYVVAE